MPPARGVPSGAEVQPDAVGNGPPTYGTSRQRRILTAILAAAHVRAGGEGHPRRLLQAHDAPAPRLASPLPARGQVSSVAEADAAERRPSADSTLPSRRLLVRASRSSPASRRADLSRSMLAPFDQRSVVIIPSLSGSGGRSLNFNLIPHESTLRLSLRSSLCVSSTSVTSETGARRATCDEGLPPPPPPPPPDPPTNGSVCHRDRAADRISDRSVLCSTATTPHSR
eukprot:CAMPEP_0113527380 /NCGR_PEP_ID=MMETSP0015_2-20120614/1264_1 /TAXON_ID=2838 /ORGANISM="Odontella" /LENGTH=226 /DNA_ID=CAMNT_0000425809 /DNA_START=808 /DNA_END=1486 /DNA_ORIENTATION=- /assembly_acc=CAM_ASM_000160